MSFSEEELEEFRAEARDLLDVAEKSLLAIDSGAPFKLTFDAVFRSFHNLKGASGMMELVQLQAHTHELENLLMQFKESTTIPKPYVTLFLNGIDGARTILEGGEIQFQYSVEDSSSQEAMSPQEEAPQVNIAEESTDPFLEEKANENNSTAAAASIDPCAKQEFLAECREILDRVSASLQKIEKREYKQDDIDALYRDIHSLKGTAYLFSCNQLGDLGHAVESSLETIRAGTHLPSAELIGGLFKCVDVIELELNCIQSNKPNERISELLPRIKKLLLTVTARLPLANGNIESIDTHDSDESTDLKLESVTQAERSGLEFANNESTAAATDENIDVAVPKAEEGNKESTTVMPKDGESNGSIRVPVALLDSLMTLVGEMVLVRNQVLQFANGSEDQEFHNLSKHLNVVTSEIQNEMMKTRMQPIGNVLNKFNRVVRDLSQDLGKQISLHIQGSETELDKSLLEAIKDPLTHIVRNSCDHGIETPDLRVAAGKPAAGSIQIRAFHEGGQVVIEVSDDGKGMHKDVLLKRGIEKGIITPEQAKQMGEKEIFGLIFAPGFSTAAKVTNVSGRGVGMDVVRTNIERIGGTVDLNSVAGKGSKILIKIPLTLAIVPALLVRSGDGQFAIPQVKLLELVRVDSSSEQKIEYLHGSPVYRLRGNLLPIVDLNQVLKGTQDRIKEDNSAVNIAVLDADHGSFGLIVDEIYDTADIVVKPLNRLLKSLLIYSGATILGDGSVALILDVIGLAKVAQLNGESGQNPKAEGNALEESQRMIHSDTQDFLLVQVNATAKHAIMMCYVHRLEEFKVGQIETSGKRRVIRYRDSILPLVSVNKHLGYSERERLSLDESVPVVVIKKGEKFFGLEVDAIVDTLSTTTDVDTSIPCSDGFVGNLNLKDQVVVVVDPYALIGMEFGESSSVAMNPKSAKVTLEGAGPLRILVAEDTKFFRKAVCETLEKVGHTVTVASDGQEALEIIQKNPKDFDLIISDVEMPRLNGFKFAQNVRKITGLANIPMLALSSRADNAYINEGLKSGFNGYLEKLQPELLLQTIESVTGRTGRAA